MKKNRKYVLCLFLMFCLIVGISSSIVTKAETSGDYSYSVMIDEAVRITEYHGSESNLMIPSTIDGYKVTSIDFAKPLDFVTEVTVPEGVTDIGYYSQGGYHGFSGWTALTEIHLPKSLLRIHVEAFKDCESLEEINIPEGVGYIGGSAFYGCTALKEINIPAKVDMIWARVFEGCTSLSKISVDEGNAYFSSADGVLFNKDLSKLIAFPPGKGSTYHIPETVRQIESSAFAGDVNLEEVWIPGTVATIKLKAFQGCSNLQKVYMEEGLLEIEESVFEACTSLKNIDIPESVYVIGDNVFKNCSSLEKFKISGNVYVLGLDMFVGCNNLQAVTVDPDNKYYAAEDGVLFDKDKTVLYLYPANSKKTSYIVPETVKTIEVGAFKNAGNLETITLPEELSKIRRDAFLGCSNLKSIKIPGNVKGLFTGTFAQCTSLETVYLSDGIERIAGTSVTVFEDEPWGVFENCNSLKELVIPATVKYMSECFVDCKNLTTVIIPGLNPIPEDSWCSFECPKIRLYVNKDAGFEEWNHCEYIEPEYHKVSFDMNGGSGTVSDITVTKYSPYGEMEQPQYEGYVFDGWYTKKEGGECITANTTVRLDGDQILYAHWSKEADYTISFDLNGGTGSFADKIIGYGEAYGELPIPEKENYTFAGWYTKAVGGAQIVPEDLMKISSDHTLYAHWDYITDYVAFYTNDGVELTTVKMVYLDDLYGPFPRPKRLGYTLNGWYTAPTGNERITEDTLVDPSIGQLYARWVPLSVEVTLDLNYSGSNSEKKIVNYEHAYGILPVPQRDGYLFMGWYTEEEGGEQIFADTKVSTLESHTLYARWIAGEESIMVTFDACGGTSEISTLKVIFENKYTNLPKATRTGYMFKGWFTASSGGTKITDGSIVTISKNHTLYAQWEAMKYTVYFDVNSTNGEINTKSKEIVFDEAYGTLPLPMRTGYTFGGWYTSAEDGKYISENSKVSIPEDHTLYAKWTKKMEPPTHDSLKYSFSNSQRGFGYPDDYKIPVFRYLTMYNNSALAIALYSEAGLWGGNCYGMCTTSGLFFQQDNGVYIKDFNPNANVISKLKTTDINAKWNSDVCEFIECMQIAQSNPLIVEIKTETRNDLENLCKSVLDFQQTGNNPVIVGVRGEEGGHALVGYRLTSVSSKESRLYVYDPNFPNTERYITLYKDSAGKYTGWYYYLNNIYHWGSNYPNGRIYYTTYDVYKEVWDSRNQDTEYVLISTNLENAVICNSSGEEVASIQDGKVFIVNTDIYEVEREELLLEISQEDYLSNIWVPEDLYMVKALGLDAEEFKVTISDVDQVASVTTTSNEVALMVSDKESINYVKILGENNPYNVTLSSTLEGTFAETELKGKTETTSATFSQMNGILIGDGVEFGNIESFRINSTEISVVGNEAISEEITTTIGNEIPVEEILMNQSEVTLNAGETKQCEVTLLPIITSNKGIIWESSDPNIVTVSDSGVIEAVGEGEASVYARTANVCAVCKVKVGKDVLEPTPEVTPVPEPTPEVTPTPEDKKDVSEIFPDVKDGAWYEDGVQFVYDKGLMSGSNGLFKPTSDITRAQIVTTLYRLAGSPGITDYSGFVEFEDLELGKYYTEAVCWAYTEGIVTGNNGRFDPTGKLTRQQMAAFFFRYAEVMGMDTSVRGDYSSMVNADKLSSYAKEPMQWAVGAGLISGSDVTVNGAAAKDLNPRGNTTRAQVATIFKRFCKL